MPGQWPTDPGFESLGFQTNEANVADVATDGSDNVRGLGGQWWSWSVRYWSLRPERFRPVKSHMVRQGGRRGVFTIVLPDVSYQSGNASGAIVVNGAHAVGEDLIALEPFAGNLVDADMLKFGHDKVYMIVGDVVGTPTPTVKIYPPLVTAVGAGEAVVYDAVPFTARLVGDEQEYNIRNDGRREYEVDIKEAI